MADLDLPKCTAYIELGQIHRLWANDDVDRVVNARAVQRERLGRNAVVRAGAFRTRQMVDHSQLVVLFGDGTNTRSAHELKWR